MIKVVFKVVLRIVLGTIFKMYPVVYFLAQIINLGRFLEISFYRMAGVQICL